MKVSTLERNRKLNQLIYDYGFADLDSAIEESLFDSVSPGICTMPQCDYSTDVEPDCRDGWCEECGKNTVVSLLVLAEVI